MRYVVLIVAAITAASPAPGQSRELPAEGTPIQAKTDFGLVSGVVQRRATDSLWVVDAESRLRAFHRREIWEISTYGTQWARGAKRGAVVGAVLGAVTLGSAIWLDTHGTGECICVPLSYVVAPFALGMPLVGAGVGLMFAPDGWSKPRPY